MVPNPEEAQEGPAGTAAAARGQRPVGCKARRAHESLRPLLAGGRRAGVHGDVPLRRVHIRRPWRGTPTVGGGGVVGNHGGVAGGVTTADSTIVVVLATTTVVAAVIVPMPVVVAAVTVAGAAVVVLARWARRCQRRRQWSGQHFIGVEHRRSSSWTGGVQVDFLHHGIRLDVEVVDDGVDVRRRSGCGLHGREIRGSGDRLLGGGLSFEIGGGGLLLIKVL
jgi:hypothetical protein